MEHFPLKTLGIPFSDVVRILAAIVLLNSVQFFGGDDNGDIEVENQQGEHFAHWHHVLRNYSELESAAALLGVSALSLYRALTQRSKLVKGQSTRATVDAETVLSTKYITLAALLVLDLLLSLRLYESAGGSSENAAAYLDCFVQNVQMIFEDLHKNDFAFIAVQCWPRRTCAHTIPSMHGSDSASCQCHTSGDRSTKMQWQQNDRGGKWFGWRRLRT